MENKKIWLASLFLSVLVVCITYAVTSGLFIYETRKSIVSILMYISPGGYLGLIVPQNNTDTLLEILVTIGILIINTLIYYFILKKLFFRKRS